MAQNNTYHDLYQAASQVLRAVDGGEAEFVAQQLVAAATDRTVTQLVADFPLTVFQRDLERTAKLIRRRMDGEPLAYILGSWNFHGLDLTVTPDVLIPREDTEALCAMAIEKATFLPQNPRILDLCAGSGCIGLAIASNVKDARVTLGELSQDALRIAKKNVQDLHLMGRVSCMQLDALEPPKPFLGEYDMIVSNPPYVTQAQMETLDPSVREFEPHMALDGGEDGLKFYRAITKNYVPILKPGGCLLFEFGFGQEAAVCQILMDAGLQLGRLARDSGERARAVLAEKPKAESEEPEDGTEETGV